MTVNTGNPGMANGRNAISILVVEDNNINRQLVQTLLKRAGYLVDTAGDGSIALEKFCNNKFDVILMDLMMPVMDGFLTTAAIRKMEDESKIPVDRRVKIVALTASSFDEDREACRKAGMNNYLCKPLVFKELTDILDSLILK